MNTHGEWVALTRQQQVKRLYTQDPSTKIEPRFVCLFFAGGGE